MAVWLSSCGVTSDESRVPDGVGAGPASWKALRVRGLREGGARVAAAALSSAQPLPAPGAPELTRTPAPARPSAAGGTGRSPSPPLPAGCPLLDLFSGLS